MALYLGTKEINIPFAKAYLGNVLKYQKITEVEFTSCPFPTKWTYTSDLYSDSASATNEFGEWNINGGQIRIYYAFDGSTSSMYETESMSSNTATSIVEISCPCSIKPSQIYVKYKYVGAGTVVQGYNESKGSWEDLVALTKTSSDRTDDLNITTNNFYSKFRIVFYRYSSLFNYARLYEFQIRSGYYKKT